MDASTLVIEEKLPLLPTSVLLKDPAAVAAPTAMMMIDSKITNKIPGPLSRAWILRFKILRSLESDVLRNGGFLTLSLTLCNQPFRNKCTEELPLRVPTELSRKSPSLEE